MSTSVVLRQNILQEDGDPRIPHDRGTHSAASAGPSHFRNGLFSIKQFVPSESLLTTTLAQRKDNSTAGRRDRERCASSLKTDLRAEDTGVCPHIRLVALYPLDVFSVRFETPHLQKDAHSTTAKTPTRHVSSRGPLIRTIAHNIRCCASTVFCTLSCKRLRRTVHCTGQ